ncbi:MAG: HAMP domain-containing histidine kinase [Oscillospiraceae bacterium]|nr:HAMP domain-containing histidine kinase [Oscillospiraceae bacterium]
MNLRGRDLQVKLWLQLALTAAGSAAAWAAGGFPAALCTAATAGLLIAADAVFLSRRQRRLAQLSDSISFVLRGAEQISISEYDEGELSILSTEIRKLTVLLREQNAQLRSEKSFLKESLEDMSHQLRTPLTSMLLILGMMRRPPETPEDKAQYSGNVRELFSLLSRMQWLIETLLSLSRVEAGAVTFRQEPILCRTLIAEALEPVSVSLELKQITVQVQITGEPQFTGDLHYCTEALGNLLKNCMEHTPEGGCIRIHSEQTALYTNIVITDSGAGIAQNDLPHLFERFYRGSEYSKNGYGIGLAFAKRVITGQNGSLQARNAAPHGAEFELRFFGTPQQEEDVQND